MRKVPVLSKREVERGRKGGCLEKIGAGLPTLMQPHLNQLRIQAKVGDEEVSDLDVRKVRKAMLFCYVAASPSVLDLIDIIRCVYDEK